MKKLLKNIASQTIVWAFAIVFWTMARQFGQDLVDEPISRSLWENVVLYLSLGLLSAVLTELTGEFLNRRLKTVKSFGFSILIRAFHYLLVVAALIVTGTFLFMFIDGIQITRGGIFVYLFSKEGVLVVFYFFLVLILIEFVKQVDKKFGPGNLLRMIKGDFFRPQEVERIIMFLDLKSSTTIAEEIGNIRFSRMLQDCFNELNIIKKYEAEIYQYVGDEAVLVWEKSKGLKNANVLEFYYSYREKLRVKNDYFQRTYGHIPIFKCGCHIGKVVMTEIGQIKREIAYHGDVMNTTARIQEQCSRNNEDFLLSEDLYDLLSGSEGYIFSKMDRIVLRGKISNVQIYSAKQKRD